MRGPLTGGPKMPNEIRESAPAKRVLSPKSWKLVGHHRKVTLTIAWL